MLPDAVRAALAVSFGGAPVARVRPAPRARLSGAAHVLVGGTPVFAKWPAASARVRRLARQSGAYRREVLFYREFAGDCLLRLPHAYHAEHQPATDDFVLLLEDLAATRPGVTLDSSAADVERVLLAVAPLHARWLDDERLDSAGWAADPRLERYALDRVARAAARGRFRGAASVVVSLLADGLPPAGDRTLVHGDLHADQALFPVRGDPVIVDWQLVRAGPAGLDTARLVTLSLPPEERRRSEPDLLAAYARVRAVPVEAVRADHRRGIAWTALVNATAYLAEEPGGFHDVLFDRIAVAAADHGLLNRS